MSGSTYTIEITTEHNQSTGPHYITLENQYGARSSKFTIPSSVINYNSGTRSFDVTVSGWDAGEPVHKVWLEAGSIDGGGIITMKINNEQVLLGHGVWIDLDATLPAGGLEHLVTSAEVEFNTIRSFYSAPLIVQNHVYTIEVTCVHNNSAGPHYITLENQNGVRSSKFTIPSSVINYTSGTRSFQVTASNWGASDYVYTIWLEAGTTDGGGISTMKINDDQVLLGHGVWIDLDATSPAGGLEHLVTSTEVEFYMVYSYYSENIATSNNEGTVEEPTEPVYTFNSNLNSHDYHVVPEFSNWLPSEPFTFVYDINLKAQSGNSWNPSNHYTLYVLGDRTLHRRHGALSIWRVELTAIRSITSGFHFKSYNFFYSGNYHWRIDAVLFENLFSYKW